jgi:integrase
MSKGRQRFQGGWVEKKVRSKGAVWIGRWREGDSQKSIVLGVCCRMTKGEAKSELAARLAPMNARAGRVSSDMVLREFIEGVYFPFGRRKWKESTRETTEQRINTHLLSEIGDLPLRSLMRERLQALLESKAAAGLSFSVVEHLRWDPKAIFSLAANDGLTSSNPASELFTPRDAKRPDKSDISAQEVALGLAVLELRERLIVELTVLAGMRPGEIPGLRWPCVHEDHAIVDQPVYRGKVDTPKTHRSVRVVAFPPVVIEDIAAWKKQAKDRRGWVFPSENETTSLWRDNVWNRMIEPLWKKIKLDWATFQVMRRSHSILAKEAGADPKVTADQMGYAVGVNLDEYTRSRLPQLVDVAHRVQAMLPKIESDQRPM